MSTSTSNPPKPLQLPSWPFATERDRELIEKVLVSEGLPAPQWGGFHPIVGEFEAAFAAYQHCRHGISMANGTLTLEVMLQALGIGPGDEVIVPAISFISTAAAVSRTGATPVFVDITENSYNLDPASLPAALSPRTKAILAVHFGGPMAEMDALAAFASAHGLLLLEDAAHAHGSEWNGRRAGSFGLASSFSFQNGKVLTAGEGGIVLTQDDQLAARLRSLANQGRRPGFTFYHHFELASNCRLGALQAAVLTAQLERLDAQIEHRNAQWLLLRGLVEQAMPGAINWQSVPSACNRHSLYLMLGRVTPPNTSVANPAARNRFTATLLARGVAATPFYPHTLYQNPLYQDGHAPSRVLPCPNAEARLQDAFWLPFRLLHGTPETTAQVAAAIVEALQLAFTPQPA